MDVTHDYYRVLGISQTASSDQIRRQFKKLALDFHPDRNKSPNAHTFFKEIMEAYEILSDSKKKNIYDEHRREVMDILHNENNFDEQNEESAYRQSKPKTVSDWMDDVDRIWATKKGKAVIWTSLFTIGIFIAYFSR